MNCSKVIFNIRKHFKDYMITNNLKSVVLGISGGIDSALCAALLRPVVDELNIDLIGVSLPSNSNKEEENIRAENIGSYFCSDYNMINIDKISTDLDFSVYSIPQNAYTNHELNIYKGNIKARVRMIHLYALAGLNKGMVISTDNLTEYYLGFWTLHGDVGDYGPIQKLWKTEVYELSKFLVEDLINSGYTEQANALFACIIANATDGLGVSKTSLEQIGADSFEQVDTILQNFLNNPKPLSKTTNKIEYNIISRFENTKYKRNNPLNIERDILFME